MKLLVADVDGHVVRPVWEGSKQTRLGTGFYQTHRLQPGPIAATAAAVAAFAQAARGKNAAAIRVIATSAARDALNPEELLSAVETASGLKIEIISGNQEAEWVFRGVTSDPALVDQPLALVDVGGGSTEFILGRGETMDFRASLALGTVRLMQQFPHGDPPKAAEHAACREWLRNFLNAELRPKFEPALQREARLPATPARDVQLVGTGGTTSILARMEARLEDFDRQRIEGMRLGSARLNWHEQRLWSLPLAKRELIIGLPRKRADVILTGVAIYAAVMELFGFSELRISTRGLRFAAVMASVG